MRIGILGLGKMGVAIAQRLRETGAEVVVWNRSRDKAEALGFQVADTPRHLTEQVSVILSILFDDKSLNEVYYADGGVLSGDLTAKLVIEMTTVRPHIQQDLAAMVQKRGGAFVECPVGGTTVPARNGKLLGLAGGSDTDIARARPVLDLLCRKVEHIGPVGAGSSLKLAINLPLLVFWQSFGEAVAMVRHLNLDPTWLVEFFAETGGGTNALKLRAAQIAQALADEDPGPVTFDINSARKDLRIMIEEAASRGVTVPVTTQALASFDAAEAEGMGKLDCVHLPARWAGKVDH